MAISLISEKACGCVPLRNGCIGIALFYIVSITLNMVFQSQNLQDRNTLIGFIILLLTNAALLFGAIREQKWFVCSWLIGAILFYIGWPLVVVGVILNYGEYSRTSNLNSFFLVLFQYIIAFVVFSYCTHIVWSYFSHLKNRDSKPPHQRSVV